MIDRRLWLLGAALAALSPRLALAATMSRITAYAFTFKGLDGNDILLASYAGHPILVVNTASLCGYTPQYTGLQALWTRFQAKGLMVLGVPSNDFGGQERPLEAPRWNFHKYLIGRDGRLKAAFTSATDPNDPRLIAAIEQELVGE
jgi:glutathione peroxidase